MSEDVPEVDVEVSGLLRAQSTGEGEVAMLCPDMLSLCPSRHLQTAVRTPPAQLDLTRAGGGAWLRVFTVLRLRQEQGLFSQGRRDWLAAAD